MMKFLLLTTLVMPVQYDGYGYRDPMAEADRRIEQDRLRYEQERLRSEHRRAGET